MKLPQPFDYQLAMQAPYVAFVDRNLRRCEPRLNPLGQPSPISGGFALTFDVKVDGQYAIRCFHKEGNHLGQRYARVAEFVRDTRLDFLVDVEYLHDGIRVGENMFPIVRMPWVQGARLDDWIDDHLNDSPALNQVRRNIAAAVETLRSHGVAHGDLQHGNVLVQPDFSIRLVDYDGMYLPTLRQYGAAEQGHRNYQHPDRTTQYEESLDLFAAFVIDLSLAALTHDPRLWNEFNQNGGEQLLFSAEDFAGPAGSRLFSRLATVPALAERTERLRRACEVTFAAIPAALAGTLSEAPAGRRSSAAAAAPPLVVRATDRDALLAHQGDAATVVGRIVGVKTVSGQRGGTITFLNFGNFRLGAFTVVAWDRAGRDLRRTHGDPAELVDSWVAVHGLLTVYRRPHSRTVTPQVELRNARALRILTAAQAATLLATAPDRTESAAPGDRSAIRTPPQPATRIPAPKPAVPPSGPVGAGPPRRDDLNDRLGKLYSSPTFSARLNPSQQASGSPQSGPASGTPRPAGVAPSGQAASAGQSTPPPPVPSHRTTPTSRQPPMAPTPPAASTAASRPRSGSRLGAAAMVAAVFFGPAGLIMALLALSRSQNRTETDRTCAVIGLVIALVWIIIWLGSS